MKDIKKIYIFSVARRIHCPWEDKKRFLEILAGSIDEIVQSGINVTYGTLEDLIGKPEVVAAEFESTLERKKIKRYFYSVDTILVSTYSVMLVSIVTLSAYLIKIHRLKK